MGADQWIALGALALSVLGSLGAIGYRLGQLAARQQDILRRIDRIEGKLDRVPKRRPNASPL